jgi:hypothetical protein
MSVKIDATTVVGMNIGALKRTPEGGFTGPDAAWQLVALYEILLELRKLNALLHCRNFVDVPRTLRGIQANTATPRKKPRRVSAKKA